MIFSVMATLSVRQKCLFSCIYNPQITISPTSSFSGNFNGNRDKNHPQSWTCPSKCMQISSAFVFSACPPQTASGYILCRHVHNWISRFPSSYHESSFTFFFFFFFMLLVFWSASSVIFTNQEVTSAQTNGFFFHDRVDISGGFTAFLKIKERFYSDSLERGTCLLGNFLVCE